MDTIQKDMFERAKSTQRFTYICSYITMMSSRIQQRTSLDSLRLCGAVDRACEDKIKEETGATSRCMPFAQENVK